MKPRKEHQDAEYLAKIERRRALRMHEEAGAEFNDGETEDVKVRQLTIREVEDPSFVYTISSEAAFLELACDKPKGWADGLTEDSHLALHYIAHTLNRPIWLQRKNRSDDLVNAMKAAMPELAEPISTSSSSMPLES